MSSDLDPLVKKSSRVPASDLGHHCALADPGDLGLGPGLLKI